MRRRRSTLALLILVPAVSLAFAWPALGKRADTNQKPIPGGWIKLRERAPQSPVVIVHRLGRTTYVKLLPAKSPGVCAVVHWHVRWPFVTVIAQPAEDHGGRLDCDTDLDRSVIWVADFSGGVARPAIYAAGLDYPLG